MTGCQRGNLISADLEVWIGADEKGVSSPLSECCEGCVDVMFSTSIQDMEQQPERVAAARSFLVSDSVFGLIGFARKPINLALGTISCSNSNCLAVNALTKKLTPVALPPGRFRLATRPNLMGSLPVTKTMGIVVVAALAASAESVPPVVTSTSTGWRRSSATKAGRRSYWPCAQRYSSSHVLTFNKACLF